MGKKNFALWPVSVYQGTLAQFTFPRRSFGPTTSERGVVTLGAFRLSLDAEKHDKVVAVVARTYQLSGQMPVRGSDLNGALESVLNDAAPPDLYLPTLRRIEEVETEETLEKIDRERLRALRELGFEIWVVVPLRTAGRAQTLLSGCADRLQPWWEEENRIVFGSPRHI